jgi:CheY-like chemotaxis protein
MSSKRALVVDDSKSARAFLARILERHEIAVDAAESAEAAIEYLTRNKPDVIFMDHMMPGMDGFQAVQSIKNNPRTSAIPILMYTSQEGDLYAGQARALGADGVLPKQIKQSDVTKLLFQLRLVADRRSEESTLMRMAQGMNQGIHSPGLLPANESAIVVTPPADTVAQPAANDPSPEISSLLPQMSLEIRAALDATLQKEFGALRGFMATTLEAHAERVHGDLAAVLAPPSPAPVIETPTMVPERRPWSAIAGWLLAVLGLGAAGVASWLWWQQGAEIAGLRTDLDAAYAEVEALRARPVVSEPAAPLADANTIVPASDADAITATDAQLVPDDGSAALAPPVIAPPVAAPPPAAAPAAAGDTMPAAASAADPSPSSSDRLPTR